MAGIPRPLFLFLRSLPLDEQDTSYLAASARICSFPECDQTYQTTHLWHRLKISFCILKFNPVKYAQRHEVTFKIIHLN